MINSALDDHIKLQKKDCLLVRGGRKGQKTQRSNSNVYQEIEKSKSYTVKLLNPLYAMSDEEYDQEVQKIKIWEGYSKGFDRTACWCCPFQRTTQWDALKEHYPGLWNVMRTLSKRWELVYHEGDSIHKRFYEYWGQF